MIVFRILTFLFRECPVIVTIVNRAQQTRLNYRKQSLELKPGHYVHTLLWRAQKSTLPGARLASIKSRNHSLKLSTNRARRASSSANASSKNQTKRSEPASLAREKCKQKKKLVSRIRETGLCVMESRRRFLLAPATITVEKQSSTNRENQQ